MEFLHGKSNIELGSGRIFVLLEWFNEIEILLSVEFDISSNMPIFIGFVGFALDAPWYEPLTKDHGDREAASRGLEFIVSIFIIFNDIYIYMNCI